jgi:voltage-gated potassium channel Kch
MYSRLMRKRLVHYFTLRDISDTKMHDFSIVSEMLDDRNRKLAEITHTDDFIVSVKLDSLMMSQISENKELKTVFEDLFSAGVLQYISNLLSST